MLGKSGVVVLFFIHFFLELNAQEAEWVVYNTSNSDLPHNQISREILVDQNNHKWIPTWGGVVRVSDSQWTIYDTTNYLVTSTYNQIGHNIAYDEYRKSYWIPTGGGITQFD